MRCIERFKRELVVVVGELLLLDSVQDMATLSPPLVASPCSSSLSGSF